MKKWTGVAVALLAFVLCAPVARANDAGQTLYPPWHHGDDDPALAQGLNFTVPVADSMVDFHGSLNDPKLVIFVAGNYYFAMGPLVQTFEGIHPEYRGGIFYVTIPPGLLVKAMRSDDTFTSGNMTFTVHPDVFAAGKRAVAKQIAAGRAAAPNVAYASNDLTIMIPKGNPGRIRSLRDLGKPGVRLVMPNPAFEGVAMQIQDALRKAGGEQLVHAVYVTKVADGETTLTHVHHRQTPLALMQRRAVAGVTWKSEAIFQERIGHPIAHVDISPGDNVTAIYAAALVHGARHEAAGRAWIAFLQSPKALAIFERYGFKGVAKQQAAVAVDPPKFDTGASPVTFASPAPSLDNPRKIVLSLSESDLTRVNEVIGNVGNVQRFYGADDVKIALVGYGPGLRALLKTSPVADRIRGLVAIGVEVVACGATMETLHIGKDALVPGVEVTAAGIPFIAERELGGWTYVRP